MQGNMGSGRGRSGVSSMDFYRRVPRDLTEANTLGAFMSVCAMIVMALLFFAESFAFLRTNISTGIAVDVNKEPQIDLNFNLTFFDLECQFLSVDVWDVLGTNRQNVTKSIVKWTVNSDGDRSKFAGRNREMQEVVQEEHEETIEELYKDGVHARILSDKDFDHALRASDRVFVDFFAPWCIWCQRLQPTWEKFAEQVRADRLKGVMVVQVDCVKEASLCLRMKVRAFPTLRWYENGIAQMDYTMDRTVDSLVQFTKRKIEMTDQNSRRGLKSPVKQQHYGCEVSGVLKVNRVPGNFHIEALSKSHNINPGMANLTHRVNHLSFGTPVSKMDRSFKRVLKQVPENLRKFNLLDDKTFKADQAHQAHHHYIKVVSTHFELGNVIPTMYQFLEQSQVVNYKEVSIPEARFSYDLSPMSVIVKKQGRKWYDYVTSLCAIIGGTFTTLGLIDATLYKVFKPKKL
eukprot:CAMPEP_0197823648 /NCGR_PEP_ID=MMETSP1437-20131217/975_1 /TAXON_ID=49252 ORGANISM="Eucampia antarctica, Strain CCMP1452" /NCGR_SAMPLE_ID=MMETSP1437 /ASSEMBLY_ACC=CAM_ASM_001096 /LENGTH=459 /DNA_ID=CAMNT_0043422915 /DNA_START=112 /DNA_END=1494 /DNA_ORIENTATION=-